MAEESAPLHGLAAGDAVQEAGSVKGAGGFRRKRKISNEEIEEYVHKKATRIAEKLKSEKFVWRKKIQRDVSQGVPLDKYFSLEAEMKRQREREVEIQKVKNRREERKAGTGSYSNSTQPFHGDREDEDAIGPDKDKTTTTSKQNPRQDNFETSSTKAMEEVDVFCSINREINDLDSQVYLWHDKYRPRKPKYFSRIHTGYEWNKYNRSHNDHDNPPPKFVQGYKFDIFYPDLVDKSKAPTYTVEKDGDSVDTCIIRFHAGEPYEDIAFRIVNGD